MGSVWDAWVETIIAERESSNPTVRRRGFLRQLGTELVLYALVGVVIAGIAAGFDWLTGFEILDDPMAELPRIVVGTTVVVFSKVWDSWIRETGETEPETEQTAARATPEAAGDP